MYVVGIYILTFGVSLAIRAGHQHLAQSSLTRTMTLVFPPLTQGTYNFILELIMLALTYLVMPKDFKITAFFSLVPAFVLAVFLDLNLMLTNSSSWALSGQGGTAGVRRCGPGVRSVPDDHCQSGADAGGHVRQHHLHI